MLGRDLAPERIARTKTPDEGDDAKSDVERRTFLHERCGYRGERHHDNEVAKQFTDKQWKAGPQAACRRTHRQQSVRRTGRHQQRTARLKEKSGIGIPWADITLASWP